MLERATIKKQSYGIENQILLNPDFQFSLSVVVDEASGTEVAGRKVVKAGTPLAGNLDARTTPFTKANDTTVKGVLLHDVDVTGGNGNGTLLVFGFVNTNMIDSTTKALITSDVKDTLRNIVFVAG